MAGILFKMSPCVISLLLVFPAQIYGKSCHYCEPAKRLECNNPKACPPGKNYCAYAWNNEESTQAMDCIDKAPSDGKARTCGGSGYFILKFNGKNFKGTNGCICLKDNCNVGASDNENDEGGSKDGSLDSANRSQKNPLSLLTLILAVLVKIINVQV